MAARALINGFMEFFLTVLHLRLIFFPSHWLLSLITIKTMDSSERGMIPVSMTIINPWKEYWPELGIEPATSCSQVHNTTD